MLRSSEAWPHAGLACAGRSRSRYDSTTARGRPGKGSSRSRRSRPPRREQFARAARGCVPAWAREQAAGDADWLVTNDVFVNRVGEPAAAWAAPA